MKITDEVMVKLCEEFALNVPVIAEAMKERYPDYCVRPYRIHDRIDSLRKKGLLPLDSGNFVSSGEILKGSSTLYDDEGNVKLQWVKTHVEKEATMNTIKELVDMYVEQLPTFQKTDFNHSVSSDDLLAVYPLGDPHVGMGAYRDESGDDWDLLVAQETFCGVFDRLVKTTPHCKEAVIVNLGDYFHRDNTAGVTERSKHVLDTDGNYLMMVDTGIKIMIQMIKSALEHHEKVKVITIIGNHDDTGAMFLQAALKHMFIDEPRITIECTSSVFQYFQHGKCFFGVHHGHTCKADKLPLVMASDRPKEWGESIHRYWLNVSRLA